MFARRDVTGVWMLCVAATLSACADPVEPAVATPKPSAASLADAYTGSAPNFVVIWTDDQRDDLMLQQMPLTRSRLADSGVTFVNAVTNSALCCPQRASLLTGQYVHHHGVRNNALPHGGAGKLLDAQTLATELAARGYVTGLVGKYMNEYQATSFPTKTWPYVPPGWHEWRAFTPEGRYWSYSMVEKAFDTAQAVVRLYGGSSNPANYSTRQLRQKALRFISRVPANQPLALFFTPFAPHVDWPHVPPVPDPQDVNSCAQYTFSHKPSVNEADVSDQPEFIRTAPLLTPTQLSDELVMKRKMCQSMQSVDRAIRDIVRALASTGRLGNTYIIFGSDQGFAVGEHRMRNRKELVFDEVTRGPVVIRGPGIARRVDSSLVQTIDLSATILDLADGTAYGYGKSLRGLLYGSQITPLHEAILIENYSPIRPTEEFYAVRTLQWKYAEYPTGGPGGAFFRTLYNLTTDPSEMTNLLVTNPMDPTVIGMAAYLANLLAVLRSQ